MEPPFASPIHIVRHILALLCLKIRHAETRRLHISQRTDDILRPFLIVNVWKRLYWHGSRQRRLWKCHVIAEIRCLVTFGDVPIVIIATLKRFCAQCFQQRVV